jgi:hypothetical protein
MVFNVSSRSPAVGPFSLGFAPDVPLAYSHPSTVYFGMGQQRYGGLHPRLLLLLVRVRSFRLVPLGADLTSPLCLPRISVAVALVYMKWKEGRTSLFGYKSAAGKRRDVARAEKASGTYHEELHKGDSHSADGSHSNEGGDHIKETTPSH